MARSFQPRVPCAVEHLELRTLLSAADAGISFPDFQSVQGLYLNGNAANAGTVLRLTPASFAQGGSAWDATKQAVQQSFQSTFRFQMTNVGGTVGAGGDGFAFVIQNASPTALGGLGEYIGFGGIPNSLAVEFDTFANASEHDPNGNHISVLTGGTGPNSADDNFSLGLATAIPQLNDGNIHVARIVYVPGTLQVFLDADTNPVVSANVDLSTTLNLDNGTAWVGFTAATYDAWENHDILSWSFADASTLMTPTNVQASQGIYADHVHVAWDAVAGAQYYTVRRNIIDDFDTATAFPVNLVSTSYDDTSAQPGVTYYYWVTATSPTGMTSSSDSVQGYSTAGPTIPIPILGFPDSGDSTGRLPQFTLSESNPSKRKVEFSVEVINAETNANTVFNTAFFGSGVNAKFTMPSKEPLTPGAWLWTAKAVTPNIQSNWSTPISFTVNPGVDFSYSSISKSVWKTIASTAASFAIADGWGGNTEFKNSPSKGKDAEGQLGDALGAGLGAGGYCLLNFQRADLTGAIQMSNAIDAVGTQLASLRFMAIDVEIPDGVSPKVNPVDVITDAVLQARQEGLRPIIYTNRHYWKLLTKDSTTFSTLLNIPLWDADVDGSADLHVSHGKAWIPFGGWDHRVGKQYAQQRNVSGLNADLNVFDPSII